MPELTDNNFSVFRRSLLESHAYVSQLVCWGQVPKEARLSALVPAPCTDTDAFRCLVSPSSPSSGLWLQLPCATCCPPGPWPCPPPEVAAALRWPTCDTFPVRASPWLSDVPLLLPATCSLHLAVVAVHGLAPPHRSHVGVLGGHS